MPVTITVTVDTDTAAGSSGGQVVGAGLTGVTGAGEQGTAPRDVGQPQGTDLDAGSASGLSSGASVPRPLEELGASGSASAQAGGPAVPQDLPTGGDGGPGAGTEPRPSDEIGSPEE